MDEAADRRKTLVWLGAGTSLTLLKQLDGGEAWAHLRGLHGNSSGQTSTKNESAETGTWHPERLSERHLALLQEVCDRIIPATDTPGARAAEVERFIDRMLARWFPEGAAQSFESGLEELAQRVLDEYGRGFGELPLETRDGFLRQIESEAIAARKGSSFSTNPSRLDQQHVFDILKWLTITGYYTSEVGMREELDYRIVPGRYVPCVEV